jgi:rare lipoprotein A
MSQRSHPLTLISLVGSLALALTSPAIAQTATYYADSFQGRRTASGEIFNTWDMTSAHPNLPFGTRVRVTNLQNGRSAVVRVNDRCHCGIDVSKAAAKELGLMQAGRAPVKVEILP